MVAGIELGKHYVQMSVKTDTMKEPETIAWITGTEQYRISTEADLTVDRDALFEIFRKLWKMLCVYGSRDAIQYLAFCLMEETEQQKENIEKLMTVYDIASEKVLFLDRAECFSAYVMNRQELSSPFALLIENNEGIKTKLLLHKCVVDKRTVTRVIGVSEKTLEAVFSEYDISSVYLVGDDFEEAWMQEYMELLKSGKRVFAGKNLFVNGAAYRGAELTRENAEYLYLDEEKVCCDIGILAMEAQKSKVTIIAEGGKDWKEADISFQVFPAEDKTLEFVLLPMNGKQQTIVKVVLENLPVRPKKTTRLQVSLHFSGPQKAEYEIKDLGFGELFPGSDIIYEGELQWEQ